MKWTRGHNPDADSAFFATRRTPCRFKSVIDPDMDFVFTILSIELPQNDMLR
jgi:hypothetical protein